MPSLWPWRRHLIARRCARVERNTLQLTSRDLYRLRRTRLVAQRAALRAQYAQQQLEELVLELERSYGTLTKDTVMDIQTGKIQVREGAANGLETREEVAHGPADNAD